MAENKYPKTIKVNGQELIVNSKEEEKQAREEAKDNGVEVEEISTSTDESGNSNTLQEDATVEETQTASDQEAIQSQENQENITELPLDDGSLDSLDPLPKKKGLEKQHDWFIHPSSSDMFAVDEQTNEPNVDFSKQTWGEDMAKYLNEQYSWTKNNDEVKSIGFDSSRSLMVGEDNLVVDIEGKKKKFKFNQHDMALTPGGDPDPEKLSQFIEDIKIHIDREVDNEYEEFTDKEILEAVSMNKFWFDNTVKNKNDFADALNEYQGIDKGYEEGLISIEKQKEEDFKNGKFTFSDGKTIS